LCFWGNFNIKSEAFPFRKIKDLTLERGGVFNSVGLAMVDGSKVNIGGFVHLDEAFQLISYVWQNPPTYVSFAQQQQQLFESDSRKSARPGSSQVQEQIDQGPQVDVETSKRALALANEIYQTSSESLVELAQQGETLDRIESNLNNIHYNLDKSDKLLRGIESLPAYIGNSLKKKKRPPPPAPVKNDHSINIKKAPTPPMDIEILCKNKDDSFSQALLRLYDTEFSCIDPDTGRLLPRTQTWKYTEIESVVMRARHQHMDIRFRGGLDRFRLMSSYLQVITNEIVLRLQESQGDAQQPVTIKVQFEAGVKQFEYGDPRISVQPTRVRDGGQGGGPGFYRKDAGKSASQLLSNNASQKVREDLDMTDQHLDEISRLVDGVGDMAVTMNDTLGRQQIQIERIEVLSDDANARIQKSNRRIDKLLQ
jgi:hypothetical protein